MSEKTFNYFSGNCSLIFVPDPDRNNVVFPKLQDLWSQVPLTAAFLILRFLLEKYCFLPLGRALKIKGKIKKQVPHNDILEAAYNLDNKSIKCNLLSIAKKAGMTERQVERWWRHRRSQDRPSTLVKFTESVWKLTYALCSVSFGLYALWDKEWLWDMDKITKNINSVATDGIWWYYMTSLANLCSSTLTLFWDVRRKDFWQMLVHHFTAIALVSLSWISNLYRIGTVLLLLHDFSDIVLELGKEAKWAGFRPLMPIFVAFVVSWVVTRLIIFPYSIITRITEQAFLCKVPLIHFLNVMLWLLLALHVMWSWMILRVAYSIAILGQEPRDLRSSSSESEENVKRKT